MQVKREKKNASHFCSEPFTYHKYLNVGLGKIRVEKFKLIKQPFFLIVTLLVILLHFCAAKEVKYTATNEKKVNIEMKRNRVN